MIDYRKYPPNWYSEIRPRILERANFSCEEPGCNFKHRQNVYAGVKNGRREWFNSFEEAINKCDLAFEKPIRVIITIAHLDHDEYNWQVKDDRLKALCQLHHLRYDAKEKIFRRKNFPKKKIFKEPLTLVGEIWKDIKNFEGRYQISNFGRIKSLPKFKENSLVKCITPEKILRPGIHYEGYHLYKLYFGQKISRTVRVHRIVAEAFLPNPLNLPMVNHIDGNTQNNLLSNLEWCTPSNNIQNALARGVVWSKNAPKGEHQHHSILKESQIKKIRASKKSCKKLALEFNTCESNIRNIINRVSWKHI